MRLLMIAFALAAMACAGSAAERPLHVLPGQGREATQAGLRASTYCRDPDQARSRRERFERCERPGVETSESWAEVAYEAAGADARATQISRWERFPTILLAERRWNDLVAQRAQTTPPSAEARRTLSQRQQTPVGTQAWAAFTVGPEGLAAVYLLGESSPDGPGVLERLFWIGGP